MRKGPQQEAKLCFAGHLLTENRNGLIVDALLGEASGRAEREAALKLVGRQRLRRGATLGADKAYDTADFVTACRERKVTPHVACNDTRIGGSTLDGRTTRHPGYRLSQIVRKRIEEHFGWGKTIGRIRQTVFRGLRRVDQQFKLTLTASNLMRLARMPIAVAVGAAP